MRELLQRILAILARLMRGDYVDPQDIEQAYLDLGEYLTDSKTEDN